MPKYSSINLVEQGFTILKMDDSLLIEHAGRTCYKSRVKIGCTCPPEQEVLCELQPIVGCESCEEHSSYKFIQQLIRRGHEAMLEHAGATVIITTDRAVSHELVRHRLASYAQESQRYVNYVEGVSFIRPHWLHIKAGTYMRTEDTSYMAYIPDIGDNEPARLFLDACSSAAQAYINLLSIGMLPEDARGVLPNATKTEIVVTMNYREWRHFFSLRALGTAGRPHPQMKQLATSILIEFARQQPAVFKDLLT